MRDKNAVDDETEKNNAENSDGGDQGFRETKEKVFGDEPLPPRPDPIEKRGKSIDEELKERFPDATPMQREMYKEMRATREAIEAIAEARTDKPSSAFTH